VSCLIILLFFDFLLVLQIEDVIGKLSADLKKWEAEADEYRIKYNIQMGDAEKQQPPQREQREGGEERQGGGGVLA
jgi:hypothetical protein